jgi:hypothetical protein
MTDSISLTDLDARIPSFDPLQVSPLDSTEPPSLDVKSSYLATALEARLGELDLEEYDESLETRVEELCAVGSLMSLETELEVEHSRNYVPCSERKVSPLPHLAVGRRC